MNKQYSNYSTRKGYPHYEILKRSYLSMMCRVKFDATYAWKDIHVCQEWCDYEKGFERFYDWSIANGFDYKPRFCNGKPNMNYLSLDRIDNFGDYSPTNCRWVTWDVQNSNKVGKHNLTNEERMFLYKRHSAGLPCSYKEYERITGNKVQWKGGRSR